MINFDTIDDLKRTNKQDGLYDIYATYFINNKNIILFGYRIQKGEDMRIDKICRSIYKNENNMSFLLDLNNILNPLTIKSGSLIFFVEEKNIPAFYPVLKRDSSIRDAILINVNKKQKIDDTRKDHITTRKKVNPLPSNMKESSKSPITVFNDSVKIVLDKDQSLKVNKNR